MRPGELSMTSASLAESHKVLCERWDATTESWNDPVCAAFEKQHLSPLHPKVKTVLRALERLTQVFQSAYNECCEE